MTVSKRIAKLAVSFLYYAWLWLGRLFLRAEVRCVVLYYHAFPPESAASFARQLDLLKRLAVTVPAGGSTPDRPGLYAAITFDDGFQNLVDVALPELKKRDIHSTIFMIADGFGKCLDWSAEFYDHYRTQRLMSEETLRSLASDLVAVGSHTLTHPMLTRLSPKGAEIEIRESKRRLEKILGRDVDLFSFPHGDYNESTVRMCRDAGYTRVFTTNPSFTRLDSDEFVIGRVTVEPADWPLEFSLKVRGAYSWFPKAQFLMRKLPGRRAASLPAQLAVPTTADHATPGNSDHP